MMDARRLKTLYKYCPHCQKMCNIKTYRYHKRLFFDTETSTWLTSFKTTPSHPSKACYDYEGADSDSTISLSTDEETSVPQELESKLTDDDEISAPQELETSTNEETNVPQEREASTDDEETNMPQELEASTDPDDSTTGERGLWINLHG